MTNWLQDYLKEAARSSMCMKIGCTTCGAHDFRKGLFARLPAGRSDIRNPTFRPRILALDQAQSLALGQAIAGLERPLSPAQAEQEGVRFLLYEIWRTGHLSPQIEVLLAGTWAGGVLKAMQEHERQREAARRAHDMRSDPEAARRERQIRHAVRLEAKKERDRLRRAEQAQSTKGDE